MKTLTLNKVLFGVFLLGQTCVINSEAALLKNDLSVKLAKNLVHTSKNFTVSVGSKCSEEYFGGQNLAFLNSDIENDCTSYLRTTIDYSIDFVNGDLSRPRVIFHDTFRFRYKWGHESEAKMKDSVAVLADVSVPVKGKHANKHLIWSREAWLKVALGDLNSENKHFVQVGLIPYQVGRGISFGSAYVVDGFLGFSPGDEIDQFAPAMLLRLNPVVDKCTVDMYVTMLENYNISFKSNSASVRKGDLSARSSERGLPGPSCLMALCSRIKIFDEEKQKLEVEPYVVLQNAPDQDLEFKDDCNSQMITYGCAVEAVQGKFNYGFEAGFNSGDQDVKPWDRNQVKVVNNPTTGALSEQYTKIYTQDPATTKKPTLAYVTTDAMTAVSGGATISEANGHEIATGYWNAFDRFRPAQKNILSGGFCVADASYEWIEKVFTTSFGVGYASGCIDKQEDTNLLTTSQLMNRRMTGFIPLQSSYCGTRLDQIVIFNQGIPRFNVKNPSINAINKNITPVVQSDAINEMSNLAFVGISGKWSPKHWEKQKVEISPNIIGYWSPQTPSYVADAGTTSSTTGAQVTSPMLIAASPYLGTELTTKLAITLYDNFVFEGYLGVFVPGQLYKDMSGTKIKDQPTGSSIAYVSNFGVTYKF